MSESTPTQLNIPQMSPGAFLAEHQQEVMAAVARVLESGWYILGKEVEAFEQEFAERFNYGGAVGVGNGTDALALALRVLGVGKGDRVATVSHTAVATVAAIEMVGAVPVFVDVTSDTYTMDPGSLSRTIQARDPIKAVIAVHIYGHPADAPAIAAIANQYGLRMIEDCAQAHGAMIQGKSVGGWGDIATYSFYPTKNLGAFGDGGMVAASNPEFVRRTRILREYGWERRYISEVPGINSRLDELQAAILRVRLPYLDAGNRRRMAIAAAYNAGLKGSSLVLPAKQPAATHVYHQYVVRHSDRERLRAQLKDKGIGTNIHYPVPVHRQPAYAGRIDMDPAGLDTTETIADQILSLPMYPELSDEMVASVLDALRNLT